MVNDPIIHHFMGKPVSAKVTKNNAKIISFKWVVKTKNNLVTVLKKVNLQPMECGWTNTIDDLVRISLHR